jgi:hypothetical protein
LAAGLDVFLSLCVLSWLFGRDQLIEPPLAVFGSFGWLAYTFALGSLSTPRDTEVGEDPGPHLEPRTRPNRGSAIALIVCLVGSLALMAAAWRVGRPALAVLSHVFALAAILLVLRTSAHLSTYLQVRGTKLLSKPRLRTAAWPLVGLLLLLFVAALWSFVPG